MRVFVTGASGFIGSAVTEELIAHGHHVVGLVRSNSSAEILTKAGGEPVRGELTDTQILKTNAAACDGVIYLAFKSDDLSSEGFQNACLLERAAIEAIGEVLAGTDKPLVVASGTLLAQKGSLATEDTPLDMENEALAQRGLTSLLITKLTREKGVRGILVQLTPTVHGKGDKGLVPMMIESAKRHGAVVYIDQGTNVWPAVHRLDAAKLFRLAFEKGEAGAKYNAVAEQGVPMRDIVSLISKKLDLPVESRRHEDRDGLAPLGFLGHVIGQDNPTSSEKTQKELGWHPQRPGLLEDMEANYF